MNDIFKYLAKKAEKARKKYQEGTYNDNRLVDEIVNIYYNKEEGRYDASSVKVLLDINSKVWQSFHYEYGHMATPTEEEFLSRAKDYIDWAFAKPAMERYRDILDYQQVPTHQKWNNNQITQWWELHKNDDLNEIEKEAQKTRTQEIQPDDLFEDDGLPD